MALETDGRVGCRRLLRGVGVVAGGAGEIRRRLKASASFQQTHLIAVNVRVLGCFRLELLEVITERTTRHKGERRSDCRALNAAMAVSARIDLKVAGKLRRVQNGGLNGRRSVRPATSVQRDMFRARTMTGLAGDSGNQRRSIVAIGKRV